MELPCTEFEQRAHAGRERSYIDDYPERTEYRYNPFLRYLDSRSEAYMLERKRRVKRVGSLEEAQVYQAQVREAFKQCIGPLPSCPLGRMEVTGTLDKGEYKVDLVRIESLPGVFITANFYYPIEAVSPGPAILFPCGHAAEGKASPMYVSFGVEAAKNGFCVLIYDPIGQGERKIPDWQSRRKTDLEARVGQDEIEVQWLSPVDAHCLVDRQLSALGEHIAAYMVAESVRALDYLLTRREVDQNRVAVSGNSGGGMMTAYMGAYDDRIRAVAPCCYITELQAMLQRILAQDAEQCTPGFMEHGLDLSDLITAAAPKPYMVGAALYDFFPIEGVRGALVESKRLYKLLGAEHTVHAYIAAKGHGLWVDTRMEVLKFLSHHFHVSFRGNQMVDYKAIPSEQELMCNMERSGFDIQDYIAGQAMVRLPQLSGIQQVMALGSKERLRHVLKLKPSDQLSVEATWSPKLIDRCAAETSYDGMRASKLLIETEPGMMIECSLLERTNIHSPSLCVVVGSLAIADIPTSIESAYSSWLFVQPRGVGLGAMHPKSSFGMFDVETGASYYARLLGQTLQGMRVTDVMAAINVIREEAEYHSSWLAIAGEEEHALTALYTAVLTGIRDVHLTRLLDTFQAFPVEPTHSWGHGSFAIGLGCELDVDDLLAELLPGRITIQQVLDANKRVVPSFTIERRYARALAKNEQYVGVQLDVRE